MAETDYRTAGPRMHEHSEGILDQVSEMGERAGTMANEARHRDQGEALHHAGDRSRVGVRGRRALEARPTTATPIPPRCLAGPVAGASQPSGPREPASAPLALGR